MDGGEHLEVGTVVLRLGATLFFVLLNGFFVATEFALVKVRGSRVRTLAKQGSSRAHLVQHLLGRLDLYLSSCQLGITVASLILGWLAEMPPKQIAMQCAAMSGAALVFYGLVNLV